MVINKGPEDGFAIENGDIPSLCYWSVHSWKLEALIPFACSDEFRPQLGMDGALGRLNHLKSIEQSCKTWAIMTFDIIWWHLVTLEKVIHYGIFAICLFFFFYKFSNSVFLLQNMLAFSVNLTSESCQFEVFSANLGTFRVLSAVPQIPSRLSCSRISCSCSNWGSTCSKTCWMPGKKVVTWWRKMWIISCIVFHRTF